MAGPFSAEANALSERSESKGVIAGCELLGQNE
jgi:hypothetical protein